MTVKLEHKVNSKPWARAGLIVLVLGVLASGAWAQEDPVKTQEFESWLKKNGYNAPASPVKIPPPTLGEKEVIPPAPLTTPTPPPAPKLDVMQPKTLTLEESQQAMLDTLPAPREPTPVDSAKAFDALLQSNMPLNPEQVLRLRQQVDVSQRAAAIPATIPPKPVSSTLMMNLAPGATPPAIRLAQGYVTSLVFVDSTGAPWPISGYEIGNPKATNLQWDGKSNILLMQAISPYSSGNIVVRLENLPTPLTLELVSGQRVVDFRADIHVSGLGPNAKEVPSGNNLPETASIVLLNILDGIGPPNAKMVTAKGGDCQAWILDDKMYLRTRFTVLSPGWMAKMSSSDGMQAYEMPKSSSILISHFGEPMQIKLEGI